MHPVVEALLKHPVEEEQEHPDEFGPEYLTEKEAVLQAAVLLPTDLALQVELGVEELHKPRPVGLQEHQAGESAAGPEQEQHPSVVQQEPRPPVVQQAELRPAVRHLVEEQLQSH